MTDAPPRAIPRIDDGTMSAALLVVFEAVTGVSIDEADAARASRLLAREIHLMSEFCERHGPPSDVGASFDPRWGP